MVGRRFKKLTVIAKAQNRHTWLKYWLVRCDCGREKEVAQYSLLNPRPELRTGTCGNKGCKSTMKPKHGMANTPTYRVWAGIIQRCTNPNATKWSKYGGLGISVCKRWLEFANFLEDMGLRPSLQHSIDRKNGQGNYSKRNCRWATATEQQANIATNVNVTYKGVTKNISEWARWAGMPSVTLSHRLLKGIPFETAIVPANGSSNKVIWIEHRGQKKSLRAWAQSLGIAPCTLKNRLNKGMSIELALTSRKLKRGELSG